MTYNLPGAPKNRNSYIDVSELELEKRRAMALTEWVNYPTDEQFTALQFATFHGNFDLMIKMTEELKADYKVKNMYGASVLHIAS